MDANATSSAPPPPPSSSAESQLLQALIDRGWRFKDMDRIRELITAQLSVPASVCTVDSIESELLNMDLRSIGGKCLPDPSFLCKTSHLRGPVVLQVCSSRDISRSSIDASGNSGNRRLLRLKLTDGHSEITAIEYSHVPSIPEDVIPGTKVRLQNKADIYSGILCLNKKVITVLGGIVQSLYEEWQLKRKYLDVSRHSLRLSQDNASSCPPPFEKLKIGARVRETSSLLCTSATKETRPSSHTTATGFPQTSSKDGRQGLAAKGETSNSSQTAQHQKHNATMEGLTDDVKQTFSENMEKPTSSSARPKVTASIPVQNQVAAQKLLQKTSQPNFIDRKSRSQRHRGKVKEEESHSITLDEWERMKSGTDTLTAQGHSRVSRDEDLARQLQEQFDLEDVHAQKGSHVMDAKSIQMSMFNFERDGARADGRGELRGRRGRGRGRGRGRRS